MCIVQIDFPLPIVACNLIIEFADFYDNLQVLFNNDFKYYAEAMLLLFTSNNLQKIYTFYVNFRVFFFFNMSIQGSSEVLQCPRCQASVPPHPGVCGTCGENVYQCHKCRAINYDEKDPFLCNSCGFSKYGKFDTFLEARPCSAVDPIESEEDRLKVRSPVVYSHVHGRSTGISHTLANIKFLILYQPLQQLFVILS